MDKLFIMDVLDRRLVKYSITFAPDLKMPDLKKPD